MADYGYLCTNQDHQHEPIIGFCFNQDCDKQKQICFACYSQQHQRHQNDCLRFNQIYQLISNTITTLSNMEEIEKNKLKNIQEIFKKNLKFISSEKDSLIILQQQIQRQQFYEIKNQMEQLKSWRNISLNKLSKNNINLQIDEIKKFDKSFDQFIQPFLNSIEIQLKDTSVDFIQIQNPVQVQQTQTKPKGINAENLAAECLVSAVDSYKENNYQETLNFANQAIKIDSNLEQAYLLKGLSLVYLEQYEEAVDSFNDCLRLNFKIETVYYHKGFCLAELKQYDEAIQCYDQAIQLKKDADFYQKKAQALFQQKAFNQALENVNQAMQIKTKLPYLLLQGAIYHELGNPAQELNSYKAALEIDSNSSQINHNVGVALFQLQQYEEALKYFEIALSIQPNQPDTINQKGITLLKLNRNQQALICFESALEYEEKPEYLANKARTLNLLKRQSEALKIFEYIHQKYGEL